MTSHQALAGPSARRTAAALVTAAFALGLIAGPASAAHTTGVLICGGDSYPVDAASVKPLEKGMFDTPAPWSGVFLLEDTTRVFKAFSVTTQNWSVSMPAADHYPGALETCELFSSGPGFPDSSVPWIVTGRFIP